MTLTYFVFVPIVAIVYTFFVNHAIVFDPANNLRPFSCFYPMVGMCSIIFYAWMIRPTVILLQQDLNQVTTVSSDTLWELRVKDIMNKWDDENDKFLEFNLCESVAIYGIWPKWYKMEENSMWSCCTVP